MKIKGKNDNFLIEISILARFGKLTAMDESVRDIGVEMFDPKLNTVNIVFTALNNAVHLLQSV